MLFLHYIVLNYTHLFVDFSLPLLVLGDVFAWALQQLLLRLSFAGYCDGCQDSSHYPVLSHTQWQTGKSRKYSLALMLFKLHFAHSSFFFSPLAHDDSGLAGRGCVSLHRSCLQFLPQVLQQE